MAELRIKNQSFDIDLVIFDKDGTLVDFHPLWGARTRSGVAALVEAAGGGQPLYDGLMRALGYDLAADRVQADGPLAVTSMSKLYTIAAAVLFQHGHRWHEAEGLIARIFMPLMSAPPTADLIRPRGDILALFKQLQAAGVLIVVVTSDEQAGTAAALSAMGVAGYVRQLLSGDGEFPEKPAPDAIHFLAAEYGIAPQHMMMVGDTVNDMLFGRNGGVGCCVGMLGGAGNDEALAAQADITVYSLDQIRVLGR